MSDPPPADEIERLRNAMAELQDAKHRLHRDAERELELLRSRVLEALLPVVDNLDRSIESAETLRSLDPLLEGVKIIRADFLRILAEFGLERVSAVGQRFDPKVHDAVAIVPVSDAARDGVVVGELEPAYRFGERIVRPAKVQVGRAADRHVA